VGTGNASTFNAAAAATINACREADGQPSLPFAELHRAGAIEYIDFPHELRGKYQSYTQADVSRLRAAEYSAPMLTLEEGVRRCVRALLASPVSKP
jgi:ADP-L-glycero-D-manno-heptose 6-epimerase